MFGGALLRFVQWLGPWNCLIAFYAVLFGGFAGHGWRTSKAGQRQRFAVAARAGHFCRECRWATPDVNYGRVAENWTIARCMHPTSRTVPARWLVSGEDRPQDMDFCEHARGHGRCGPHGRFWEPGPQLIEPAPTEAIGDGR
jgi:hypothetical protein